MSVFNSNVGSAVAVTGYVVLFLIGIAVFGRLFADSPLVALAVVSAPLVVFLMVDLLQDVLRNRARMTCPH